MDVVISHDGSEWVVVTLKQGRTTVLKAFKFFDAAVEWCQQNQMQWS